MHFSRNLVSSLIPFNSVCHIQLILKEKLFFKGITFKNYEILKPLPQKSFSILFHSFIKGISSNQNYVFIQSNEQYKYYDTKPISFLIGFVGSFIGEYTKILLLQYNYFLDQMITNHNYLGSIRGNLNQTFGVVPAT